MAAVTTITLIKRFTYRGDASEEFSNTYSFKNAPPGDSASWLVFANDMWLIEKLIFPGSVFLVAAYGYDSDDPKAHSVWGHDYTTPGPPPPGTMVLAGQPMAGDQAACVEWVTDKKNSRGKTIYLRKYLHAGAVKVGNVDELDNTYLGLLDVYKNSISGHWGGLRAREHDYNIVTAKPITWVTTRTLRRRGKRPPLKA